MKASTPIGLKAFALAALVAFGSFGLATAEEVSLKSILDGDGFYFQKREKLTAAGWTPVVSPGCKADVYGNDQPPAGKINICDVLPEIESCSGQGNCAMHFENKATAKKLNVYTYGDYGADWNKPDSGGAMIVESWE